VTLPSTSNIDGLDAADRDTGDMQTEIRLAAARFRRALEQGGLVGVSFASFPRGACGDSSELLGEYLRDSGFGHWTYVSGAIHNPFQSHAWIERDGVIVDITADQFDDMDQPVIVTVDRSWHDRFGQMAGAHTAGLAFWTGPSLAAMRQDYITLRTRADMNV
jgi:hypothetical protein